MRAKSCSSVPVDVTMAYNICSYSYCYHADTIIIVVSWLYKIRWKSEGMRQDEIPYYYSRLNVYPVHRHFDPPLTSLSHTYIQTLSYWHTIYVATATSIMLTLLLLLPVDYTKWGERVEEWGKIKYYIITVDWMFIRFIGTLPPRFRLSLTRTYKHHHIDIQLL